MQKKIICVFVVDDSRVSREMLAYIIEKDPELKVVGFAKDGEEALRWLQSHTCDVVTMDIHMPHLNGFEVTERIMQTNPIPTVIISSGYTPTDNQMAFQAIEAGALAILEKPASLQDPSYNERSHEIVNTIKMISEVKVIKRRSKETAAVKSDFLHLLEKEEEIRAVAIGASLGGPLAICQILSELPSSFPVPIFIVQHIAEGFTNDFIQWLQSHSKLRIYPAKDKEIAKPGCVYIATDNCQMKVKKGNLIILETDEKRQPSVGNLFKSMAETYGPHCAGIILTGMGRDGAQELLFMKQKGAYTIAQDQKSCIMFGMPKEAILLGAAVQILPLDKIAFTLNSLVAKTVSRKTVGME